jgi:serine/threonine protein kinase
VVKVLLPFWSHSQACSCILQYILLSCFIVLSLFYSIGTLRYFSRCLCGCLYGFLCHPTGCISAMDVSGCGLGGIIPLPIVSRLFQLHEVCCVSQNEAKMSKLMLPPAHVCSGGIESIRKFFFDPEPHELESIADAMKSLLDSPGAACAPAAVDLINELLGLRQERAPVVAQQLWVSLVSHKSSDAASILTLIEKFLDHHSQHVIDIVKWRDHGGRSAEANSMPKCKRAMTNRVFFLGLYDIPDGAQHEYMSATCTLYIVDRVDGDKRTPVALKFMKNKDEFLREISSRQQLLAPIVGHQQTQQDCIIEIIDSYDSSHAAFQGAVQKRPGLVDYEHPCLLVMPAAERSLRAIMDSERITKSTAIKDIFHRILTCVKYMHDRGFIHGDLKPRNIVRWLRTLKLIDLDASARIGKDGAWSKHSSAYIPPESVRLCISLRSDNFDILDSSASAKSTVTFTFLFPTDIPSGASFTIAVAPVCVTAVVSFIVDAADYSRCIHVKDSTIVVTLTCSLLAGEHNFVIVGAFDGNLPEAEFMHAQLEHVLNTLDSAESISKDGLAKCIVTIKHPRTSATGSAESHCSCSRFPRARAHAPNCCTGVCGVAHPSHDMWALGVILYRLCAREAIWFENDEDNIKNDSGHLLKLALWTDGLKMQRLQKIEDTVTRGLVSNLLEKDPWKRPRCILDVLSMPFDETDFVRLKLEHLIPHESSPCSNLVGNVIDIKTGKFSDAAYGLRSYQKVSASWNEEAACSLGGMQDEVERLRDCPKCAEVQADVLEQLGRVDGTINRKLASLLAALEEERKQGLPLASWDSATALRCEIAASGGWYYGTRNACPVNWPPNTVEIGFKTFSQPMCKGCQDYCLDYSSISANLHYIVHEAAVEKQEWNGVRDRGRAGHRIDDFMKKPQAQGARLTVEELVALRFYTSHSFECINRAMRDMHRSRPHPLPGIVTNIQRGLKKLRALGSNDAASKQTVVLWRGMSDMKLSDDFSSEGGTELAPMSTTTDVGVAISYAVKKDTQSAMLFRFVTRNNLERGADVQWLSMFPSEAETLFPPLTFLQRTRSVPRCIECNGATVTIVELSTTLA